MKSLEQIIKMNEEAVNRAKVHYLINGEEFDLSEWAGIFKSALVNFTKKETTSVLWSAGYFLKMYNRLLLEKRTLVFGDFSFQIKRGGDGPR